MKGTEQTASLPFVQRGFFALQKIRLKQTNTSIPAGEKNEKA
jgi:hypothetical protein